VNHIHALRVSEWGATQDINADLYVKLWECMECLETFEKYPDGN
jgi:hypothetical protein